MMLVAVVAEMLAQYTAVLARVVEHLLNDAPFPRRVRPPPPPNSRVTTTTTVVPPPH